MSADQVHAGPWGNSRFTMHTASCHCGAVNVEVRRKPRQLTSCNCSVCRRYGSLWAYYKTAAVRVRALPGALDKYTWGDRSIRFVRCRGCGCVTHWEPARGSALDRLAVNARNFEPALLESLRIRHFDGAATWKYLD